MSYSFNVKGASKSLALAAALASLDNVARTQPCHSVDVAAAKANAEAAAGLLPEDPEKDVSISCSGYIGGTWNADGQSVQTLSEVSISVTVRNERRPDPA